MGWPRGATAALSSVAASSVSQTLASSRAERTGFSVFNGDTGTLFLAYAATASNVSYTVKIVSGAYFEVPNMSYSGVISGAWTSPGSDFAYITEWF